MTLSIKKEVNNIGQKTEYILDRFIFKKNLGRNKESYILILVKNLYSKDEKIIRLSDLRYGKMPFNYRKRFPEKLIKVKVNKIGLKSKNIYKRFKYVRLITRKQKRVIVENIKSGELKESSLSHILAGRNPFFKRNLKSWIGELKSNVNKQGKKWKNYESFIFIKAISRTKSDNFIIEIKNQLSGIKKKCLYYDLKTGRNPFRRCSWLNPVFIQKEVNRIGKSSPYRKEHFIFIKQMKKRGSHRPILIESVESKKRKICNFDSLSRNFNPFRKNFNFDEKNNSHPKVIKLLKKYKIKILSYEKKLIRSRPDIICETKTGRVFIVEIKSDLKKWSKKELEDQLIKYNTEGFEKYKNLFIKTYIVSINGRYGISLENLKNTIKYF